MAQICNILYFATKQVKTRENNGTHVAINRSSKTVGISNDEISFL